MTAQSIGNYVNNGSFENFYINFINPTPYYWSATAPQKYFGGLLTSPNSVPLNGFTYQWPYHGKNYFIISPYSPTYNNRSYPKNVLKSVLIGGQTYCLKMYVNLSNQSTHGIDAIGVYLGDNYLDTIKKCNDPITYLMPQVENPSGNIITDTLNWIPVTGTFVATGNEKYLMLGNFKSDVNTNKTLVNPTHLPANFSDYVVDAISLIELDLPAYAGKDTSIVLGDSAFIGRAPDFAIDPGCYWYSLPGMIPMDTISGMWVKPTTTTTYVVKQILDCSTEKWDTVVVYMNLVGLDKLKALQADLKLFPIPAKEYAELSTGTPHWLDGFTHLSIYNNIGQLIREEELHFENNRFKISTADLPEGMYSIEISNAKNEKLFKKLVVAR